MRKELALEVEAHGRLVNICHLALEKLEDLRLVGGGHGAGQDLAAGQMLCYVRGAGLRLGVQLPDYFLRVGAEQVEGDSKPAVDGMIEQAMGKGKEEANRH